MTVERDWFWFWFWFYYALWLASVFTLVLVLRQSSENRSIIIVRLFSIVDVPFRFTGRVTTSMALMDYSGIHRSRGCLTNRGLSQVSLYMPTTD